MNIRELIPKDKCDLETARKARETGYPRIEPILPELLEWMQDYNWPVAREIEQLLLEVGDPVIPYLAPILEGDDNIWKYWILTVILEQMPPASFGPIMDQITRIAEHPTSGEREEEVDLAAKDLLELYRYGADDSEEI